MAVSARALIGSGGGGKIAAKTESPPTPSKSKEEREAVISLPPVDVSIPLAPPAVPPLDLDASLVGEAGVLLPVAKSARESVGIAS